MRTIHRDIAGIILLSKDNRILLGKSYKGGPYAGYWIIPGGGIDKNETKLEAARREMLEEVGIDITPFKSMILDKTWTDKQGKVLRDTSEKVNVDMTFYVIVVRADKVARDIEVQPGDDIVEASWHSISVLVDLDIPPVTRAAFQYMGLIHA